MISCILMQFGGSFFVGCRTLYVCDFAIQETQLSPKDRAMRHVSRNLANCPTRVPGTTCTTSPEQIEVMKLEGYSGTVCNKHVHSTMT